MRDAVGQQEGRQGSPDLPHMTAKERNEAATPSASPDAV